MNTLDAIQARRAVKHYDADFNMPTQDKLSILSAAMASPTSFNIQNWRFVLVEKPVLRQEIQAAAWDQIQITQASMLIVLCADLKAWDRSPERYWVNAPIEAQNVLVPMIKPFYADKPQLQRDEAMRSVGITAQTIMLAAKALGYDSCPMIGFDAEKVGQLINLPDDHVIGMLLVVGKATQPAWPKPGQLPMESVVLTDGF